MLSYIHFTREERICLQNWLKEGKGIREIARMLGRSPSSVSREVKRNSSKKGYNNWRAQILYITRRRQKSIRALKPETLEYNYTIEKLNRYWTPEQISERFRKDNPGRHICYATIYRRIKQGILPGIKARTHLRRKGKNYKHVQHNSNVIHPDRTIAEWSDEIKNRSEFGHYEGDTVYGGIGKGALVTCVDRKGKKLFCRKVGSRNATEVREAIEEMFKGVEIKSITFDNGAEFAEFRELERNIQAPVYFAEPHKPWQRGTNENTNGILRFFFPKGFDFRQITQEDVDEVVDLINNRPRKCLNWLSPNEFCVALD